MCTVVVLIRPGHRWPVALAANRDERVDRAWDPPAAWWPEHPGVIGGRDRSAGGTWMALGPSGVVAAVLNRPGTLGPEAGKRSRGALPILAVSQPTAAAGAQAIAALDAGLWRGFNMVIADAAGALFVRGTGQGRPVVEPLPAGLHMVTAHDPNDLQSPRIARHLPRFRAATPPEPGGWHDWPALLGDRGGGAQSQLDIDPRGGFGTVCASLVALPADAPPIWLFAAGRPHAAPFRPV
ncbi:MAG: NRDE family protein [Acetobacteraceae bacterium]|nr:NRDE family protein [Acetobacteraceae bacterium]